MTEKESQLIFDKIIKKYVFNYIPSQNPFGVILGGQPGSGKSYLSKKVESTFNKNFIFISTDDLRYFHPDYLTLLKDKKTVQNAANIVNPQASAWTEKLIKHCIENGYNIIVDSTLGGNISAVLTTINLFKKHNYHFSLHIMAVPALVSRWSILQRYAIQMKENGFARWTRMEDHDSRFQQLPLTLQKIIEVEKLPFSIAFYERILDSDLQTTAIISRKFYENPYKIDEIIAYFHKIRENMPLNTQKIITNKINELLAEYRPNE